MPCYFGCDTKRNKLLWGLTAALVPGFGAFGALSLTMYVLWVLDCRTASEFSSLYSFSEETYDTSLCNLTWIEAAFWGFIVAFVLASLPCYMMCCCSQSPAEAVSVVPTGNVKETTAAPASVPESML